MKRLTLIWLTVLALLAQGWTSAVMATAMALPTRTEAVAVASAEPCAMHAQAADRTTAFAAAKAGDCCGAASDCHCVSACGSAMLPPVLVAWPALPAASPTRGPAISRTVAAPAADPFRPPIL